MLESNMSFISRNMSVYTSEMQTVNNTTPPKPKSPIKRYEPVIPNMFNLHSEDMFAATKA